MTHVEVYKIFQTADGRYEKLAHSSKQVVNNNSNKTVSHCKLKFLHQFESSLT